VSFTATVKRWRHLDGMLFYTNPQKAELTALAAPAVRADLAERLPEGSFIYIVTDSNPDAVKIGKTSNLSQRLSTLPGKPQRRYVSGAGRSVRACSGSSPTVRPPAGTCERCDGNSCSPACSATRSASNGFS
jgi:hypothetical protein